MAATAATASIGNGDLADAARATPFERLPEFAPSRHGTRRTTNPPPRFVPPPPERHIAEGSFFVGDDRVIRQVEAARPCRSPMAASLLKADGTHDRHADRRPDRPSRPCPPRAPVAERRLAGGQSRRRPQGSEPRLRPVRLPPTARSTRRPSPRPSRRRRRSAACPTS